MPCLRTNFFLAIRANVPHRVLSSPQSHTNGRCAKILSEMVCRLPSSGFFTPSWVNQISCEPAISLDGNSNSIVTHCNIGCSPAAKSLGPNQPTERADQVTEDIYLCPSTKLASSEISALGTSFGKPPHYHAGSTPQSGSVHPWMWLS